MTTREERSLQKQRLVDAVRQMRLQTKTPTVRLLGEALDIKSTATVHNMIRDLVHERRLVYADDRHLAVPASTKKGANVCPVCRMHLTQPTRA